MIRKIFVFSTILFISLMPVLNHASTPQKIVLTPLNKKLHKLVTEFEQDLNIGIIVKDLETGKILYSKNANRYFMPASNEKLFTAFAALKYLNRDFIYQTQLFVDTSKIVNGVLNDNIYLKFSGDPTLTLDQLDHLIHSLSVAGIKRVNGTIIVDDSVFDQIPMSPGSSWDDKKYCWSSPINAFIVDHNCVSALLKPAQNQGQPAILQLPNQPQFMRFINNVITKGPSVTNCRLDISLTDEFTYTINGCIRTSDPNKNIMMSISDPRRYMSAVLAYLLNKNNIVGVQNIAFQQLQTPPKLLASVNSPPLLMLITAMLKDSDNTIANSLFKTMGALYTQGTGTWENGHRAMRDILIKTIQLDIPDTTLIDGAGGSRYGFVTPKQILILLHKISNSPDFDAFLSALPISGVDGTLKLRMNTDIARGKVRAKTGTETAVSTLSGYLETRKKHKLIFSIMINGFVDLPSRYRTLEDSICTTLIENG